MMNHEEMKAPELPIQIAKPTVLAEILMYSGIEALKNLEADPQFWESEAFSNLIFGVAALFVPGNPDIETPEGLTLAQVGEHVRSEVAQTLEGLSDEEKAEHNDAESLVPLGVMCFVADLQNSMEAWGETHKVEDRALLLEGFLSDPFFPALCFDWALRFLGDWAAKPEDDEEAGE